MHPYQVKHLFTYRAQLAPPQIIGPVPGDIRIERGNTYIYIPITTMLLLSAGLSLLLYLLRRLL